MSLCSPPPSLLSFPLPCLGHLGTQYTGPGMEETWPGIFREGGSGFPPESPVGGTAWHGAQGLFSGPLVSRVIQRIGVLASPLAFSSQALLAGSLLVTGCCCGPGAPWEPTWAGKTCRSHLVPFRACAWGGGQDLHFLRPRNPGHLSLSHGPNMQHRGAPSGFSWRKPRAGVPLLGQPTPPPPPITHS